MDGVALIDAVFVDEGEALTDAVEVVEGDADTARSDWLRVLAAYPDFPGRWRKTLATQWGEGHLSRIFNALESAGVPTGCL